MVFVLSDCIAYEKPEKNSCEITMIRCKTWFLDSIENYIGYYPLAWCWVIYLWGGNACKIINVPTIVYVWIFLLADITRISINFYVCMSTTSHRQHPIPRVKHQPHTFRPKATSFGPMVPNSGLENMRLGPDF